MPGVRPLSRVRLFALAADENVESRLIARRGRAGWTLKHGPFARSAFAIAETTSLDSARARRRSARRRGAHTTAFVSFVPDARLDDLMMSWASDGGGVGPHFDSYDVFLLQVRGQRRWRIGRTHDASLVPNAPLKILRRFAPETGVRARCGRHALPAAAVGRTTASPSAGGLHDVFDRQCVRRGVASWLPSSQRALADSLDDETLYTDAREPATQRPRRFPRVCKRSLPPRCAASSRRSARRIACSANC